MGQEWNCLYSFCRGHYGGIAELSVKFWLRALWGNNGVVCTVLLEGIMGE